MISEFQTRIFFFLKIKAISLCIIRFPVYLGLVCLFQMDFIWLGVLIWFILISPNCAGKDFIWTVISYFFLHAHNNIFPYGHFQKKRKNMSSESDLLLTLWFTWALFHAHSERREPLLLGSYYIPINTATPLHDDKKRAFLLLK